MAKKPTIYDVAERAVVSIATVSLSFTQPHRVRESTRKLVMEAAHELGYLPSASARGLARGKTGAIGLFSYDYFNRAGAGAARIHGDADALLPRDLFSDDANEEFRLFPLYHDEVQRGVEMECRRRGFVLMVGEGGGGRSEADINDVAGRVDGLAVFPNTFPVEVLRRIAERIPVVELADPPEETGLNRVSVENTEGMRVLTNHLIHHHGHRAITFSGPSGSPDREQRFAGYVHAMAEAGLDTQTLPAPGRDAAGTLRSGVNLAKDADATIKRLIAGAALPEALVCSVDAEAILYLDALERAGVEVPGRIAVTGFDGLAAGRVNRPTLTTVRQPMIALGRAAASILIHQIANPGSAPVAQELPVKLVVRESCGCG
ncbi:LacI family DNA-binding transcriptional regulator [Arthrobacter sp. B2a2-09]|uniref:LacI family DNA-binding transcriptional regulator n=1 Tax=Arthrobacter sp. B2a2-09 TaxID=2952822 RepID=UPI0022CD5658|nr:LacI family DNA-binding transcriptional regulator [Arthrobacter sp. B2a2-09]MCZ9884508.1 LacI family transcriptional regulator [Arthrobacter sp. B2a2-09]